MKKIFSFLLLFVLVFSLLSLTAFATEGESAAPSESNVFSEVYAVIIRHSDKILSGLAFAASLFLALAYRTGIIPLIRGGLNTLGGAVAKLKEETDKASEISEKAIGEAKDKLENTALMFTSVSEKLAALEGKLEEAIDEKEKAADTRLILETQIDMLYDIFMSSSIPLFQKEAVGEKISLMKKKLAAQNPSEDKFDE